MKKIKHFYDGFHVLRKKGGTIAPPFCLLICNCLWNLSVENELVFWICDSLPLFFDFPANRLSRHRSACSNDWLTPMELFISKASHCPFFRNNEPVAAKVFDTRLQPFARHYDPFFTGSPGQRPRTESTIASSYAFKLPTGLISFYVWRTYALAASHLDTTLPRLPSGLKPCYRKGERFLHMRFGFGVFRRGLVPKGLVCYYLAHWRALLFFSLRLYYNAFYDKINSYFKQKIYFFI